MDNLDEFLTAEPTIEAPEAEAPEPEAEAAPEPQAEEPPATAERPRGPDGKFIAKGEETEGASPAPQEPTLEHPALLGERRRRQEAEARIAELEARIAPQPQPVPQAPQGAPDMFEDPEGYTRYIAGEAAKVAREEAFGQFQYQRIEASAAQFAPTVPDYGDKVQVFQQMAQVNPHLLQELYRQPNPAEYAYNTAKTQIEISQFGGIEGLIKARVEEALKTQPVAQAAPPIPETLADAQSSRGSSTTLTVPSLDDILKR